MIFVSDSVIHCGFPAQQIIQLLSNAVARISTNKITESDP